MSQDRKIYFETQVGQKLGEDILRKADTADKMFVRLRTQSLPPDFTPEEAASRAGNLVAYYAELALHHADFMAIKFPDPADHWHVEFANSHRLKAESALIAAARYGDYRKVKEMIRKWVKDGRPIFNNLFLLISRVPDRGRRFVLPLPAWMLETAG